MQANHDKFQFIISHRTFDEDVQIEICNSRICSTKSVTLLGDIIATRLSFDEYITGICKKAAKQLNVLRRFKNILSTKNKEAMLNAFILSHFKYCSVIWHFCRKTKINMMEKILERSLRFVFLAPLC